MLRKPGQPLLPPLVEEEQQCQQYERTYDETFFGVGSRATRRTASRV